MTEQMYDEKAVLVSENNGVYTIDIWVAEIREKIIFETIMMLLLWPVAIIAAVIVLVNMPEEYAHIIDIINEEEDNGIEFKYFNPATENNRFLSANLDLYGALFTESYNKQNNF